MGFILSAAPAPTFTWERLYCSGPQPLSRSRSIVDSVARENNARLEELQGPNAAQDRAVSGVARATLSVDNEAVPAPQVAGVSSAPRAFRRFFSLFSRSPRRAAPVANQQLVRSRVTSAGSPSTAVSGPAASVSAAQGPLASPPMLGNHEVRIPLRAVAAQDDDEYMNSLSNTALK